MPRIRVTLYFANGNEQSSHDCDTAIEAYDRLKRSNMDGLAFPVGTTCGGYEWRCSQQSEHTYEGFVSKLALCCNDPAQYSENLIRAGICARPIMRGSY